MTQIFLIYIESLLVVIDDTFFLSPIIITFSWWFIGSFVTYDFPGVLVSKALLSRLMGLISILYNMKRQRSNAICKNIYSSSSNSITLWFLYELVVALWYSGYVPLRIHRRYLVRAYTNINKIRGGYKGIIEPLYIHLAFGCLGFRNVIVSNIIGRIVDA